MNEIVEERGSRHERDVRKERKEVIIHGQVTKKGI